MKSLLLASVLALSVSSANAFFVSAGDLWKWINGNQTEMTASEGYVVGVFDAMQGGAICAPQDVKLDDVKKAAYLTLKNSPQNYDKPADIVIGRTFVSLWPCKEKPSV